MTMKNKTNVERIGRKRFLVKVAGSVAAFSVMGTTLSSSLGCRPLQQGPRWSQRNRLPNAGASTEPVPGTRAELTPIENHYRVINKSIPAVPDMSAWRLKVEGLVEDITSWDINQIRAFESMSEFITLTCISNPVGGPLSSTTRWTGVSLQQILPMWKLKSSATHLKIRGIDGFFESVSLETIWSDKRVMLAYEWDGVPLPIEHGYPLRIFIPNRYGMKQPKWIASVEATDHWEPGFSVKNTWDKDAIMQTTSVIDTVIVEDKKQPATVLVGGIAHAGSRGISKVEVQVDRGEWKPAQLREPLSDLTWVIWRYEWPFQKGEHEFAVRAYDKSGVMQDETKSPPYPRGATGIFSKSRLLGD